MLLVIFSIVMDSFFKKDTWTYHFFKKLNNKYYFKKSFTLGSSFCIFLAHPNQVELTHVSSFFPSKLFVQFSPSKIVWKLLVLKFYIVNYIITKVINVVLNQGKAYVNLITKLIPLTWRSNFHVLHPKKTLEGVFPNSLRTQLHRPRIFLAKPWFCQWWGFFL